MANFLKKHAILLILVGIILLGLLIRLYKLTEIPSGFFCDEASIGYNAYTILNYGTDEYGKSFPFFFQAFGDYKSPVQIYSTVPFIKIFGLSEFSTRLPSSIYGILSIIAIYLLAKELFRNQKHSSWIGIFSALLLTISPWHIHFSRIAFEMMPFTVFSVFGLYFLLKAQKNKYFLFLSITSFVVAIYSYFPARIFIPLLGLGFFCIYYKFFWQNKKETFLSLILLITLLIPFIFHSLSPVGLSRWQQINIFTQPPNDETVSQHIIDNYFSHFSVDFLFTKGDIGMPGQFLTRHSVKGIGELYFFQFPLIILGLIFIIKKKIDKPTTALLLWLILYPVGSMLTIDKSAQATRSIIGIIPLTIISALGLYYLTISILKIKKILTYSSMLIVFIIILISFLNYLNIFFTKYTSYSSDFWGWQYGAKDIVKYFSTKEPYYDQLIMAPEFNAPEIFFKFYEPKDCLKCKVGLPDTNLDFSLKQLFAVTPNYLQIHSSYNLKILKTIYYPNGKIAFLIGEIVQ